MQKFLAYFPSIRAEIGSLLSKQKNLKKVKINFDRFSYKDRYVYNCNLSLKKTNLTLIHFLKQENKTTTTLSRTHLILRIKK